MCVCFHALNTSGRVYGRALVHPLHLFVLFALFTRYFFNYKKSRSSLGLRFSKLSTSVLSYCCFDQDQQLHSRTESAGVSFLPWSTSVKRHEGNQEWQTWPLSGHGMKCENRCLMHVYLMISKNQKQHSISIL